MAKRDSQILEMLTSERRIEVKDLAERLGVSNVTMRKDLDALQARGLVVREHGFATISNPNDVRGRLAYHYDEKRLIARRACELVEDGATVMVENGSCCALLAFELAGTRENVHIVTNSAFIADYIHDAASSVTLLGGVIQRDSQVTVGPMVRLCAGEFMVDRLFVGTDGWTKAAGFTNDDQMRAEAVRAMAEQAGEVVIVTESAKFSQHGLVPLRLGDKVRTVVTDAGIPDEARSTLEAQGITVLCAG